MGFHRRNGSLGPSEGFTLIEIMVALAILGTGLFVLLDSHFAALQLYDSTRESILNRNLLEQAVARAEIEVMAGNLSGSGEFSKRFADYGYSYDAQQTSEDDAIRLYEVMVTLTGPNNLELQMTTYVFDPRM